MKLTERMKELASSAMSAQRAGDRASEARLWKLYHDEAYYQEIAQANWARQRHGMPLLECNGACPVEEPRRHG